MAAAGQDRHPCAAEAVRARTSAADAAVAATAIVVATIAAAAAAGAAAAAAASRPIYRVLYALLNVVYVDARMCIGSGNGQSIRAAGSRV